MLVIQRRWQEEEICSFVVVKKGIVKLLLALAKRGSLSRMGSSKVDVRLAAYSVYPTLNL